MILKRRGSSAIKKDEGGEEEGESVLGNEGEGRGGGAGGAEHLQLSVMSQVCEYING